MPGVRNNLRAKAWDKDVGGLPKQNVYFGSSLVPYPRKTYQISQRIYKKDGHPSLVLVVMVIIKRSPEIGVVNVGASLRGLPQPWKRVGWPNFKRADLNSNVR